MKETVLFWETIKKEFLESGADTLFASNLFKKVWTNKENQQILLLIASNFVEKHNKEAEMINKVLKQVRVLNFKEATMFEVNESYFFFRKPKKSDFSFNRDFSYSNEAYQEIFKEYRFFIIQFLDNIIASL